MDSTEKILADYNDVFADIMNVFLYEGERVIKEDDLENSKDRSQYKAEGGLHEQERDVSKFYNGSEMRIAFLGIEHQNKEEKYMPLRVISYDGSAYRAQLLKNQETEKREQKPYPVITLVLYFGISHWNHGKTIHEVLDIPKELKPFVSDYRINVIEVAYLKPEEIEKFRSDFRLLADFFVQKRLKGRYIPPNLPVKHVDEFLKLLSVMVGDKRYQEIIEEMNKDISDKGGKNMCEIYDQIEQQGIQKGIEQGIERGIEQGIEQGKKESIISLFQKGLLSASDAAAELKVKEEEFLKLVKNNG